MEIDSNVEEIKKSKTAPSGGVMTTEQSAAAETARTSAQAAALYIPFLTVEHLLPPKLPSHEEMENVLLALRKNALVEEYFGNS
jgi:pre-mRNA-splicing factor ISY1